MSKPKTKKTQKIIAATGILFLTIGIILWFYTNSVIHGLEQLLNDPKLPQTQRWEYEGSLEWWKTAKKTTYDPIAIVLITLGICAIEYAVIYLLVGSS